MSDLLSPLVEVTKCNGKIPNLTNFWLYFELYINNSKYIILSILPSMEANMANNRGYIGHGVQHTRFLSSSMKIKQIFGYIGHLNDKVVYI